MGLRNAMDEDRLLLNNDAQDDQEDEAYDGEQTATWRAYYEERGEGKMVGHVSVRKGSGCIRWLHRGGTG